MPDEHMKDVLLRYLQRGRDALVWKLDGLGEYDARRPLTPTATNLLGIVKHVASVEAAYLGETFGRPFPEPMPWFEDTAERNADMWATPEESRADIVGLYRRVWAHSNETVATLPLDAIGHVAWWPPERADVSLSHVLTHLIAETERHAGHADIVRELIDGAAGVRPGASNMPDADQAWWADYRARVEQAAEVAAER